MLEHPPYSPDLVLCDFFMFLKLKISLKGSCSESIENIQATVTRVLRGLWKTIFSNVSRYGRDVNLDSKYIEGICTQ